MSSFSTNRLCSRGSMWLIVGVIVVAFLAQGLAAILANSQTLDELPHFAAGYSYWATGDFRLNPEHPPFVKLLCLLPIHVFYQLPLDTDGDGRLWRGAAQNQIGFQLLYGSSAQADRLLNLARLPNLALGLLLVMLVGWWSYRLWGPSGALLASSLAALEPTVVAHSTLVTTDLAWALFATATLYTLWEFATSLSWKWLLATGVCFGLALASKFSAVSLLVLVPLTLSAFWGLGGKVAWLDPSGATKRPTPLGSTIQLVLALAILAYLSGAVVWASYFFQDPILWSDGFQRVWRHQQHGHSAYFWGNYSERGWLAYFPVALIIKTQIPTLLLVALSLGIFYKGKPFDRAALAFLLLPLVAFIAALLLARINIGVRHALHVYPLLHILAGRVTTIAVSRDLVRTIVLALLVTWSAISAFRIAPFPLAYFNELVGGPKGGRHVLSDSNLDWGQGLRALARYVDEQDVEGIYLSYFGSAPPEYYGIRYQYVPAFGPIVQPVPTRLDSPQRELLAISDLNLKGILFDDKSRYAWLMDRVPTATIAHSIYVYDITGDTAAHMHLAGVYLENNLPECAMWQVERVLALDPDHAEALALRQSLSGIIPSGSST